MPICKREGFENFSKNPKQHTFHDNEEVFYCETTKQIFRDYEEYFRHVMVINSTIWQCEATKRENLTYAEALKSERRARKKMEQFKDCLRPVVLLLVEKAQQSSLNTLSHLIYAFIRSRFFITEDVEAIHNTSSYLKYVVVGVIPTSPSKIPPDGEIYDPTKVTYKLRRVGGLSNGKEYVIAYDNIRRGRNQFSHDNLQMFIKDNTTRMEGILRPKPESYKKYVTDRKLTFAKMYIGKLPHYEPSKPKKITETDKKQSSMASKPKKITETDKKQSSMAKYLTKPGETPEEEAARLERVKTLKSEMERVRKEKEAKQAELERKKAERLAKIEEEATALAKRTDDLQRFDQKLLPKFQRISTHIPIRYFGDCMMIQEFMHSFVGMLSGINVFKNNISFYELTRAFTVREIAGPLSDILLILLGTIFELQQEEESECSVEYTTVKNKVNEPYITIAQASKTHDYVRRHFAFKLNELPLDAVTVSEVLRLHFLASGAQVNEKAERWRVMYRNGYYSSEDPGLVFRKQFPHVLRALKMYTVYQMPMLDIFQIIHTLIAQILTYSSTINLIEERMELAIKSKMELRTVLAVENRRVANVEVERKKLVADYALLAKEQPDQAKQHEEKLNKKVADLLAMSAREKKKFENQLDKLHNSLFDYMVFLGEDRAYRKYYVLESMPGVFVEHSPECYDTCMSNPPTNVPRLVGCPKTLKEIRVHLSRMYAAEDDPGDRKKRRSQPAAVTQDNKENKENQAVLNGDVKLNGDLIKIEVVDGEVATEPTVVVPEAPPAPPTQYQLMMCTGDPSNCIVHDEKNPDRQRWAYFYTEEDLDALISSLNPLGERESFLKEQLTTMRALIVNHVRKCPVDVLSIEDETSAKLKQFKVQMREDTRKKYNAANYGFPNDTDLSEVMYAMLVDRVLQMEIDITTGDLGKLKVKNLEKWRTDVQNNCYDPQGELTWGEGPEARPYIDPGQSLGDTVHIKSEENADKASPCKDPEQSLGDTVHIKSEENADEAHPEQSLSETVHIKSEENPDEASSHKDPEQSLGDTVQIKSEENADEGISFNDSSILRQCVKDLSSALLQIEQGIEQRFLNEPFGVKKEFKDKEKMDQLLEKGRDRLKRWETSLMHSTSYSQVFLHLNILHGAIKWQRSTNKSCCQICRRMTDPEKMLLCDECNAGTHMFCMKPKMKTVPEGNWYCMRCVNKLGLKNTNEEPKKKKRKRAFLLDEEDIASEGSSRSNSRRQSKNMRVEEIEEELIKDDETMDDDDAIGAEEEEGDDENSDENADEDAEDEEAAEEEELKIDTNGDPSKAENEDNEESTIEEDEEICAVCSYNGGEIACTGCKSVYHLDCVDLKRPPRSNNWSCNSCKANQTKKRKSIKEDESTEDEEYDQPLVKRSRASTGSSKRSSVRNSMHDSSFGADEVIRTNNNNRRRARHAGDNLPLNSPILYDLLDDIMKHDSSWPFLRPVSHSEVPDYHTIIKDPMDFAKVKSKLNMGKYTINEELLKDIELVFKNCDIYNQEGNEIYEAGSSLEKFVMERCKDLNLPFQPSDMNRS